MAQIAKVSTQVEIKAPADKIFGFFRNKMSHLVRLFPDSFKSYELIGGNENEITTGSVFRCTYDIGVGPKTSKFKIEALDDDNKTIVYELVEGDTSDYYKSFKAKLEAIDMGNNLSSVKWSIEIEKANANAPSPDHYLDFAVKVSEGLEPYFSSS